MVSIVSMSKEHRPYFVNIALSVPTTMAPLPVVCFWFPVASFWKSYGGAGARPGDAGNAAATAKILAAFSFAHCFASACCFAMKRFVVPKSNVRRLLVL